MKKTIIFAAAAAIACLVSCNKSEPIIPAEVSVSPSSVTFEADGGTLNAVVTTNRESYTVTGVPSWLTVAQNGNELSLTADPNTVTEELNATLTISAEDASCTLKVRQKAGSPYPGYAVAKTAGFEYGGTILYQFLKPQDGYDGGQGYLILNDEDGNSLVMWIYTELFGSEEEVTLTPGTYTRGEDAMGEVVPVLYARKNTYMAGASMVTDDEEEAYIYGSYYESASAGSQVEIVDGSVDVSLEDDGTYIVKAQVKDIDGNEYRIVYIGEVHINAEGAGYPGGSGHMEMISEVNDALCSYMGASDGKTRFQLMVNSGDEENPVMSVFEFLVDEVEFDENYDLTGTYLYAEPEEGEGGEEEPTGVLVPGAKMEIVPGFEMPVGTYAIFGIGDYVLGDTYDSLILQRQEDGSYILTGSIMDSEGSFVMYLNVTTAIPIFDGTAEEE